MLKKVMLGLALVSTLFLAACPAPNTPGADGSTDGSTDTSTEGSSSGANFSKEQYITLLNCLKTQQPDAAVAIDQAIAAANQLPDSAFDNADSPIFAIWAEQAKAVGCGS